MIGLICLAVIGMLTVLIGRRKIYDISLPKTIVLFLLLIFFGVSSTNVMHYIENGVWNGTSLFGAVLFPPLLFYPIARIVHIPYEKMMDFVSPSALIMISIMKANCILLGCCQGIVLWQTSIGEDIRFPSPFLEAIATLAIIILLLRWERTNKHKGSFCPVTLILYGCLRFCLNWFRAIPKSPKTILPMGNIWSLVAIVIGAVWLLIAANIKINNQYKEMQQQSASAD